MKIKMLMGASGHGKTYELYKRIVDASIENPSGRYFIVVPEQSSLQAQKDIVRMHPNRGVFNIDVLTFGRMCFRIFDELGVELNESIDDTGKNLIVRKSMDMVADRLRIIKPGRKQGLVEEVKSMISELKQYGIKPDELENMTESLKVSDRLRQKLSDICEIYKAFESCIEGRYTTVEDRPEAMLSVIDRAHFFDGAVVAFDGFTGFTPVQYKIIEKIVQKAEKVIITATLPYDEPYNVFRGEEELFAMSKTMIARAGKIADRLQADAEYEKIQPDYEKYRFAKSDELAFLENNLFRYNGNKFNGEVADIRLYKAQTPIDEISFAAAEILKNVREQNLRFRDIAVVVGDIDIYADEAVRIFTECGIPVFVDTKRSIMGNPLVEYIRAVIELVTDDYSYESVFRFLKNVLCDIDRQSVDILENYVIAYGVRGRAKWLGKFRYKYPGKGDFLPVVNDTAKQFTDKTSGLYEILHDKNGTVSDKVRAIYDFIEQENVFDKLLELAQKLEDEEPKDMKKVAMADQYRKTYSEVIGLLEQLDSLMGSEVMDISELSGIMDAGFDEIKVGLIPPSVDCVTVGNIERTRLEHVKAMYILGVNEGLIPQTAVNRGLLSEQDRRMLENQVELAPTPREKVFNQYFYLYLNMTEPEKELCLMCHKFDSEGRESKQSRIWEMIKGMFPGLKETDADRLSVLDKVTNAANSLHLINSQENSGQVSVLLDYFMRRPEYADRIKHMTEVFMNECRDNIISPDTAAQLYKGLDGSSVSRIETFADCEFKHFVRYGLNLDERVQYSLDPRDMGTLLHNAIRLASSELHEQKLTFADIDDEERRDVAVRAVNAASAMYSATYFTDDSTNMYMKQRITDMIDRTMWALGKQLAAGSFTPEFFEEKFEYNAGGQLITGQIDRIDMAYDDRKVYVKVIDYKSGDRNIKLNEIYAGLKLQLMVYLKKSLESAALTYPELTPEAAGALYNHIDNPIIDDPGDDAGAYEKKVLAEFKPKGIINGDEAGLFDDWDSSYSTVIPALRTKGVLKYTDNVIHLENLECLMNYAVDKMVSLQKEIDDGNIKVNPYEESCKYCPYGVICGIRNNETVDYRRLPRFDNDQGKWEKFGLKAEKENE